MEKWLKKPVKEFMTKKVIAVRETEPLKNLFHILDKNGILGVPVVNRTGKVVGIVTESDLIRHFTTLKPPRAVSVLGSLLYLDDIRKFNENLKEHCAETVKGVMKKNPVVVRETASFQQAIDLMAVRKVNRLPVTGSGGKLVGILTRQDIIHQLAKFIRI